MAISHSTISANPDFDGLLIPNVEMIVLDDDRAGLLITESANSTDVLEGGFTDTLDDQDRFGVSATPLGQAGAPSRKSTHTAPRFGHALAVGRAKGR